MAMRIDVSLAEWPTCASPSSDEQIKVLKERLSTTPTKDPEERAQHLAARTARTALLHKLEMEAKQARAKRANDLVKENRARKLRMEAAAVARASSKIEKATRVESEREAAKQAKREAATARRAALFEAVRVAREVRQASREQRQAELAKLEANASSLRTKKIESTVCRTSAQVKHALRVAAGLKEKEREEAAAAAAALADRLSAATSRRQEHLAATVESAASVIHSAEKVRLRHLYDEMTAVEERRARLAKAMDKALSRREEKLVSITNRVAAENARVADVVAESRLSQSTTKPAAMRHALAARLQAAEVRRLEALTKVSSVGKLSSSHASSRQASLQASPQSSPTVSPSKGSPPTPWSAASPPVKMNKPHDVIVISTEEFHNTGATPSSQLISRLRFRPRMLLATAPARHAAAAGRRQIVLNLTRARASHFGTVRVAVVLGRRAAREEFCRAFTEVRVERAADRAAFHIRAKARTAARLNERVNVAKVNRSNLRLRMLNTAIAKEEKRLAAQGRLSAILTVRKEGRWEEAKTFAVRVRRATAMEQLICRGAELQKRCLDASLRREAFLAAAVSRATVRCLSSLAAAREATIAESKTADDKTMQVDAVVNDGAKDAAKDATPAVVKPTDKEAEAELLESKESKAEETGTEATPAGALKTTGSLPILDLDARIAELRLLVEKRLQAALSEGHTEAEATGLAQMRAGLLLKAAAISAAGAARAEARAEAKRAARASAMAVKASVDKAAAMAGLHGRAAMKHREAEGAHAAAIPSAPSSTPSSTSSSAVVSEAEEWCVVAGQNFKIAD